MNKLRKIKQLPLIIRIVLACALASAWVLISPYFSFTVHLFEADYDWVISIVVLLFIYITFFGWNSSNRKSS
jgi:TRAP-type C4-dicarboxylate transport system permease small subunit